MKDFMIIFLGADYQASGLSPEEIQARMGKWFAWNTKMREQGVVGHGDALIPGGKRISGENRTVTDGPFVESKELIGGYYIIKAEDYDGAIKICEDYPDYDIGGSVEVREVMVFEG